MPLKTRGFAQRIDIAAPQARVWSALCGPSLLPLWLGGDARIRPQQGGIWLATVAPGLVREAMIDVFDAPRRLRLIYQPPADLEPFDGAVVDDFLLDTENGRTVIRLLCSGVPELPEWNTHFIKLRAGAERSLSRLKVLAEQRERMAEAVRSTP